MMTILFSIHILISSHISVPSLPFPFGLHATRKKSTLRCKFFPHHFFLLARTVVLTIWYNLSCLLRKFLVKIGDWRLLVFDYSITTTSSINTITIRVIGHYKIIRSMLLEFKYSINNQCDEKIRGLLSKHQEEEPTWCHISPVRISDICFGCLQLVQDWRS